MGQWFTRVVLGFTMLGLAAAAQAQRDLPSVLTEIDRHFVCPQFQPDDAARRADLLAFSRALASVGPTRISYRQAAYIRARMLERHNCTGDSAAMASTAPAAANTAASPSAASATALDGVPN